MTHFIGGEKHSYKKIFKKKKNKGKNETFNVKQKTPLSLTECVLLGVSGRLTSLNLSSDKIKIKPSVADLCTSTTLYRKGFSKQKFDITIYNIQQLICHNQGGENIHWNAQVFLRFFFPEWVFFFNPFLLIPKRVVKHFYITRVYKCTIIQSEVCGHY